jgi:butyryl-CoA dehydrogenase
MLLTQDQEMIRDAVRALPRKSCGRTPPAGTRNTTSRRRCTRAWPQLGAYGICVPEELRRRHLDYLTLALVLEEIAAGDGGTSTAISVTNCPVNAILMRYGNEAAKARLAHPAGTGEMLGAFCLTEPHVGSDASACAPRR